MAYKYRIKRRLKLPGRRDIWKSDRELIKVVAFALLFMAAGAGLYVLVDNLGVFYIASLPEMLTTNYTQVAVSADMSDNIGVITLTAGCKQIIAHTEPEQAVSIADGLAGYVGMRPNTHDLIRDTFNGFGVEVIMLKITEIRNSTFMGRLLLREGNKVLSLDARPSDGTAIAVRVGAPIYINDNLLEEYGEDIC